MYAWAAAELGDAVMIVLLLISPWLQLSHPSPSPPRDHRELLQLLRWTEARRVTL